MVKYCYEILRKFCNAATVSLAGQVPPENSNNHCETGKWNNLSRLGISVRSNIDCFEIYTSQTHHAFGLCIFLGNVLFECYIATVEVVRRSQCCSVKLKCDEYLNNIIDYASTSVDIIKDYCASYMDFKCSYLSFFRSSGFFSKSFEL